MPAPHELDSQAIDQDVLKETKSYLLGPAPKLRDIEASHCSGSVILEYRSFEREETNIAEQLGDKLRAIFEGKSAQTGWQYYQLSEKEFVQLWQDFFRNEQVFTPDFSKRLAFRENLRYISNEAFGVAVKAIAQTIVDSVLLANKTILIRDERDRSEVFVTTHVLHEVLNVINAHSDEVKNSVLSRIRFVADSSEIAELAGGSQQLFEVVSIDDFVLSGLQADSGFHGVSFNLNRTNPQSFTQSQGSRLSFKHYCIAARPRTVTANNHSMQIVPAYFVEPYQEAIQHDGIGASPISVFGSWCTTDYGFEKFILHNFGPEDNVPPWHLRGKYEREDVSHLKEAGERIKGNYLDSDLQEMYERIVSQFKLGSQT